VNTMKDTYTFSGHTDYARRFCNAIHVGDTKQGKAVWAWRDGLWIVSSHCGASVFYRASRVMADVITRSHDTKPAREALGKLIHAPFAMRMYRTTKRYRFYHLCGWCADMYSKRWGYPHWFKVAR